MFELLEVAESECILEISLSSVRANWRLLQSKCPTAKCGATVKANAYGLGADKIAPALYREGCRNFFVANIKEAISLNNSLVDIIDDELRIYVIYGFYNNHADLFEQYSHICPILSSLSQVLQWANFCTKRPNANHECILHIDSGMHRLGLIDKDVEKLTTQYKNVLDIINISYIASHLCVAENQSHEMNMKQLMEFNRYREIFPNAKVSFANSSGIFLGPEFQCDLARPGVALYSINPIEGGVNPMNNVVKLLAPVIHLQDLDEGLPVGYCMRHITDKERNIIATLPIGYADGYHRCMGNEIGKVFINGVEAPVIGNVSMDLITIDCTHVPNVKLGDYAEIYGENCSIDELATRSGTIGYEILTSLGHRFKRIYNESTTTTTQTDQVNKPNTVVDVNNNNPVLNHQ